MEKSLNEFINDIYLNKYISGSIVLKSNGQYNANVINNNGSEHIYSSVTNRVMETIEYWKTSDIGFDLEINFNLNKEDSFVVNTYENITINPPIPKSEIFTPFFKKDNKKYSKCSLKELEEYVNSIKNEEVNVHGYYN